ncbi:hypothetical protein TNCV_2633151 [Trichonephila clavipes]|nr:hypothetical protein TNCV_2633151 [Trichonephila clavipes]
MTSKKSERQPALHLQSDGMVERLKRTILINLCPNIRPPPDALLVPEKYVEKLQARMEEMHHLARDIIDMASEKMKTRYDARATGPCGYHLRFRGRARVFYYFSQCVIGVSIV